MIIKKPNEIAAMRDSGRMLALVLQKMRLNAKAGMTPKDMSALAQKELRSLGGEPAFLGFFGYPDVICISVNNQVQHSIPTDIPFKDGDVVNFDFGVWYKNMITDGGISIAIGNKTTPDTHRLLQGTEQALLNAIEEDYEGCLSVPDVYGKVPRNTKVRVKALDEEGREFRVTAEGFLARIFQHEIDHTNGVVFIDHIKDNLRAFFRLRQDGHLEELDYEKDVLANSILW